MSAPKTTKWPLEEHTKAKHTILRRYLQAWFPILSKYHGRIVYLDGFCGPGRYSEGEEGSPLIALTTAGVCKTEVILYFIDQDEERIAHLNSEVEARKDPQNLKVVTRCKKFDAELKTILDGLDAKNETLAPTFAFIDPFGFSGMPFTLVKRLLAFPKCEVLINLNAESINRFIEHPNEKIVAQIVETLGTEEARGIPNEPGDGLQKVRALYQKQLESGAKFVRYFEMRNKGNRVVYYLFFASNNRLGHLKFKEAMWHTDYTGDFSFSDATASQPVLFGVEAGFHVTEVEKYILPRFIGKGEITGRVLLDFVEDRTPFLKKHLTPTLKKLEDEGRLVVDPKKVDGKPRKRGSFPDDVLITFLEGK